jgi:two-component system phosphate regulon sensor histidine kinase PhoR
LKKLIKISRGQQLFWKIYTSSFSITIASVITIGMAINYTIQKDYGREVQQTLQQKAHFLAATFSVLLAQKNLNAVEQIKERNIETDFKIELTDPRGKPIGSPSHALPPALSLHWESFSLPIYAPLPPHAPLGELHLAMDFSEKHASFMLIQKKIFIIAFAILLVMGLINWWPAKGLMAPFEIMRRHAQNYGRGDFSKKIELGQNESKEVLLLANTLNELGEDITKKLITINHQNNENEAILASMVEGVLTIDHEKKILHLNQPFLNLFSIPKGLMFLKGVPIERILQNSDILEMIETILKEERFLEREIHLHPPKEPPKIVRIHGTSLKGPDKKSTKSAGVLLVFNDITAIMELVIHKKRFVDNVSHEMKTPLTSILGYVETIIDGKVADTQTLGNFLNIIHQNVVRLKNIIDDLLSLSAIERYSEQRELNTQLVEIEPIILNSIRACHEEAIKKNVQLNFQSFASPSPVTAYANSFLLQQALINLIVNAIRYGPPGTKVWIELKRSKHARPEYTISVADNGRGIAPEFHERIFERFFTPDKARSRELGGSGLGLAIVKHIALFHKGHVKVESELGKGSIFILSFPLLTEDLVATIPPTSEASQNSPSPSL